MFLLSGTVKPGETLKITMHEPTMPLNNNGDVVVLLDADEVGRSRVAYTASQARAGAVVSFGKLVRE